MNNEGIQKHKPLIKPRYPQDYELEWGEDVPPAVLTHLVRVCDMLSGYVDQEAVSVGKLAYKLVHQTDIQDSVICLMFNIRQEEAAKIRRKMIKDKRL